VVWPGGDPGELASVREGQVRVQDEGSQLVAAAVARAPLAGRDERWLDLCAGPGGKTALLGGIGKERGATVTAVELKEHRAGLVRRAVGDNVRVVVCDATDRRWATGDFDRVLVDVPCSGLGALRRRPEARWRRTPADLAALRPIQQGLLVSALQAVRPGGVVGYVTCSPALAETTDLVASVLGTQPDFEPVDARELLSGVPSLGDGPAVQLWPHRHGTDAMFLALFRRR
jgi:16S rRNA (cytosine967-C5)-methyltransferase